MLPSARPHVLGPRGRCRWSHDRRLRRNVDDLAIGYERPHGPLRRKESSMEISSCSYAAKFVRTTRVNLQPPASPLVEEIGQSQRDDAGAATGVEQPAGAIQSQSLRQDGFEPGAVWRAANHVVRRTAPIDGRIVRHSSSMGARVRVITDGKGTDPPPGVGHGPTPGGPARSQLQRVGLVGLRPRRAQQPGGAGGGTTPPALSPRSLW